jgi:hypothetical protein
VDNLLDFRQWLGSPVQSRRIDRFRLFTQRHGASINSRDLVEENSRVDFQVLSLPEICAGTILSFRFIGRTRSTSPKLPNDREKSGTCGTRPSKLD